MLYEPHRGRSTAGARRGDPSRSGNSPAAPPQSVSALRPLLVSSAVSTRARAFSIRSRTRSGVRAPVSTTSAGASIDAETASPNPVAEEVRAPPHPHRRPLPGIRGEFPISGNAGNVQRTTSIGSRGGFPSDPFPAALVPRRTARAARSFRPGGVARALADRGGIARRARNGTTTPTIHADSWFLIAMRPSVRE